MIIFIIIPTMLNIFWCWGVSKSFSVNQETQQIRLLSHNNTDADADGGDEEDNFDDDGGDDEDEDIMLHKFIEIKKFPAFPCQEFWYLYLNSSYMYLIQKKATPRWYA